MMIVERFISHVCLYGARGTTPGHDCGQSLHDGAGPAAEDAAISAKDRAVRSILV